MLTFWIFSGVDLFSACVVSDFDIGISGIVYFGSLDCNENTYKKIILLRLCTIRRNYYESSQFAERWCLRPARK
jgi:hypothetical protein